MTVWRVIDRNPNIVRSKMVAQPNLKEAHKQARLDFARGHMDWTHEWQNVIWSDEKKFNLDGPDGYSSYWRDLRKEPRFFSKRNFGGGSVMIWAGFSAFGTTAISFVNPKTNSQGYQDILEANLLPYVRRFPSVKFVFQQNNASIHASKSTKAWISTKKIVLMDWPSRSPDLNPIENLWGILVRDVYADCRQFNSVEELKTAILDAWSRIGVEVMKKLVDSMKDRVFSTIQLSGCCTKY